jgi:hypothetical protein
VERGLGRNCPPALPFLPPTPPSPPMSTGILGCCCSPFLIASASSFGPNLLHCVPRGPFSPRSPLLHVQLLSSMLTSHLPSASHGVKYCRVDQRHNGVSKCTALSMLSVHWRFREGHIIVARILLVLHCTPYSYCTARLTRTALHALLALHCTPYSHCTARTLPHTARGPLSLRRLPSPAHSQKPMRNTHSLHPLAEAVGPIARPSIAWRTHAYPPLA